MLGDILKVSPGPIVTLYEMEPAPGTKTSRVIGLSDDIARDLNDRLQQVPDPVDAVRALSAELQVARLFLAAYEDAWA